MTFPAPFIDPVKGENIDLMKWNPSKGGTPCAPRIHHKIKKEAKDEALRDSRRGGGGGHDGKNGNFKKCKDDKRGPHYHGLDRKGDHIPPHLTILRALLYQKAIHYGVYHKDMVLIVKNCKI